MKDANYTVVKYVPDPARNEALNIGIVLWSNNRFALRIADAAVARVIRENPRLERDALLHLKSYLTSLLEQAEPPFTAVGFLKTLETRSTFPVVFSEPRTAAVTGDRLDELEVALDRLVSRVVHPKRRGGGAPGLRAVSTLERELRPFLQAEAISRKHTINAGRTGVARSIDFYANSGSNVALDILNLSLVRADDIRLRADAEAYKVWDLLGSGDLVREYHVYCDFSSDAALAETNKNATRIIEAAGGQVTDDLDAARDVLEEAATRSTQLFR
jgi:hypothetical protein